MIFFTEHEIDTWIKEDVPYYDLTTRVLGIGDKPCSIGFITREKTMICGTEEVRRIFDKFNIKTESFTPSGTIVPEQTMFMKGEGNTEAIHNIWKVCINILEYSSGIATRTSKFVDKAKQGNRDIVIAVTRKVFPGTKKLSVKAALYGGAVPHRLGLSESILIFDEHIRLIGGIKNLPDKIREIKKQTEEKKIEVEVHNLEDALFVAGLPVDFIQVDKLPPEKLKHFINSVKEVNPHVKIAVAGGINMDNIAEYSQAGIDLIVTSFPYFGKPADIKADIYPL